MSAIEDEFETCRAALVQFCATSRTLIPLSDNVIRAGDRGRTVQVCDSDTARITGNTAYSIRPWSSARSGCR